MVSRAPAAATAALCALLLVSAIAGQEVTLDDDARTGQKKTRDEDVSRDAFELAASKGYEVEEHPRVTTRDGYILKMIRIVGSPKRNSAEQGPCPGTWENPPVLLQHGLIDSAATWVMNMPKQSLGFVLADQGYDVWLGNNRGNSYSMEHERLQGNSNGRDEGFWDFSWDEMAEYDLPAEIDYVLKTTGAQTLSYISHSQGTAQGFAAFSENPELARKVGVHVALAPVAFVGSTDSALFQVASYLPFLKEVATLPAVQSLGNTLLGTGVGANIVKSLVPGICNVFLGGCDSEKNPRDPHNELFDSGLMGNLFSLPDMTHLNQTRIPVYLSHLPEGTSVRNLLHWAQSVRTNKFQKYDFGPAENQQRYGQEDPPEYDLLAYSVPTLLIYGSKDPIANRKDVRRLARVFQQTGVLLGTMEIPTYDHNDFTLAADGFEFFFEYVLDRVEGAACAAEGGEGAGEEGAGEEEADAQDWRGVLQTGAGSFWTFLSEELSSVEEQELQDLVLEEGSLP
ncbi:lipase [Chloropicon roscoffensis]|uniref:Lipase n=2 Tax=Chloropicon roscoffensis TaxID=1461544 RepID=A0AAX4PCJ3_9CHLO